MSSTRLGQPRAIRLLELERTPYDEVHQLQLELVAKRQANEINDTLVLVEHTPTITLGRRANESNILASAEVLAREGVSVHRIERGGDVTYHGPGQLVAYPILKLTDYRMGPSDYMHALEEVVRRTCADYGLETHLREKIIGVWIGHNKVCALGVRIRRGISFHGLALNVNTRRDHWEMIVPCGITDGGVTSLAQEIGTAPAMSEVRQRLVAQFARVFNVTF